MLHLCRVKVTKNGFAGQSLGDQPALLLLRGKSGRSESPPADVAEAVNALMQAVHFPAAASITSQASPKPSFALLATMPHRDIQCRFAAGFSLILAHPLSTRLLMAPFGKELFHSCPQTP